MPIDIFNRVTVNIGLNTPINTPLPINNTALISTDTTILPVTTRFKAYTDAQGVFDDYGASVEYNEASTYFGQGQSSSYFIIVSMDDTGDPPLNPDRFALAIEDGYQKSYAANYGGFFTLLFGEDSPISDSTSVIAVLNDIATVASNLKTKFCAILNTNNISVLNQVTGNAHQLIQAQVYKENLAVLDNAYSSFTSDGESPNKLSDAACAGMLASISLDTISNEFLDGQTLQGVVPLPVGQTDTNSILFDQNKVNGLVNNQINIYSNYGPQTQYSLGLLAIEGYNISVGTYYIVNFLSQTLKAVITSNFFFPSILPYSQGGVVQVVGQINIVMKEFVAAGAIDPIYSVISPTLDFSQPAPRTMGAFIVNFKIDGIAYSVDIIGSAEV